VTATAEVTGGSVDNLRFLSTGNADIAFAQVDAAVDALKGADKFKDKPFAVRAFAVVYPNRMHVVSVEGAGVKTMDDLKGKRVSTGSGGSATEVFALRLIEAAGIDAAKDLKRERLGVSESVNAIKDRKIDAFFWVGGLPTAAVTDLGATPGVKVVLVDHAAQVEAMNKKYDGIYSATTIPAGTYSGVTTDNKNASVWNVLAVLEKTPEKLVYDITKTLFEKKADLALVHSEANALELGNQTKALSVIPFHPGAARYFKERGVDVGQ
jgi:uncharacterized protein